MEYNIYCDESCHLEHDGINIMALGAIWCDKEKKSEIFNRIREIKVECGLPRTFEIKWNKVSPSKKDFYYKMYFDLLKVILVPQNSYNIYIDKYRNRKNTRYSQNGTNRVSKTDN